MARKRCALRQCATHTRNDAADGLHRPTPRKKLTSNLTGELKETFEKLDDCWNEYAELCDKEVFIHAFHLGMQIAIAAMTERDD